MEGWGIGSKPLKTKFLMMRERNWGGTEEQHFRDGKAQRHRVFVIIPAGEVSGRGQRKR